MYQASDDPVSDARVPPGRYRDRSVQPRLPYASHPLDGPPRSSQASSTGSASLESGESAIVMERQTHPAVYSPPQLIRMEGDPSQLIHYQPPPPQPGSFPYTPGSVDTYGFSDEGHTRGSEEPPAIMYGDMNHPDHHRNQDFDPPPRAEVPNDYVDQGPTGLRQIDGFRASADQLSTTSGLERALENVNVRGPEVS
jgi:hypothetical protein